MYKYTCHQPVTWTSIVLWHVYNYTCHSIVKLLISHQLVLQLFLLQWNLYREFNFFFLCHFIFLFFLSITSLIPSFIIVASEKAFLCLPKTHVTVSEASVARSCCVSVLAAILLLVRISFNWFHVLCFLPPCSVSRFEQNLQACPHILHLMLPLSPVVAVSLPNKPISFVFVLLSTRDINLLN